jgi:hypothetical protein
VQVRIWRSGKHHPSALIANRSRKAIPRSIERPYDHPGRNPCEGSEYHEGDKGSLDQVLLSSLRVDNHDSEVLLIELPFFRAQDFKAEHLPVVWSRVLYRTRLFLRMDRSENPQPSHLGKQCGSFQSQFHRSAAWSTNDPADLLQCFHNQGAIGVFQSHQ